MSVTSTQLTNTLNAIFLHRRPKEGDVVNLRFGGIMAYRATVTRTNPDPVGGTSVYSVPFLFNNPDTSVVIWYAMISPLTLSSGGAAATPFQITDAGVAGAASVLVRYGLVNNATPTFGGVSLSSSPLISLGSVGTWLIYLKMNVGAGVCSVQAVIGALPADDATFSYNILGEVDVISAGAGLAVSAIRMAKVSSLTVQSCGVAGLYSWGAQ